MEKTAQAHKTTNIVTDEVWSFVGNAKEKVWICLALDRDSREVLGVALKLENHIGAIIDFINHNLSSAEIFININ